MMRKRWTLAGLSTLSALLAVSTTAVAEVNVNINIGPPPQMIVVPQTPVYYAPSLPHNFFYYDGRYYTFRDDAWYWSGSVRGPWGWIEIGRVPPPVLRVPIAYYPVRPVSWGKHKRGGPPPWAPAHGYRRKHEHGGKRGHGGKHHHHDHDD
jgi:hypothetical protein